MGLLRGGNALRIGLARDLPVFPLRANGSIEGRGSGWKRRETIAIADDQEEIAPVEHVRLLRANQRNYREMCSAAATMFGSRLVVLWLGADVENCGCPHCDRGG